MARVRGVDRVKAVCGATFVRDISLDDIIEQLTGVLGRVESRSEIFDFDFTDYYQDEMGDHLRKVFLSFEGLIHPGRLPEIKRRTNEIEEAWSVEGGRRVNLDPGYMTPAKLVVASAKDFAHRVFLGDGIYGDVQLRYAHHRFRAQEWTFPDYRTDSALAFFEKVRETVYRELKDHG